MKNSLALTRLLFAITLWATPNLLAHEICREKIRQYSEALAETSASRAQVLTACQAGRGKDPSDRALNKLLKRCETLMPKASHSSSLKETVEKCKIDAYRYSLWFEY